MSGNVAAVIFARGGSKGVPRKNLRELAGKPLIAHSIACAAACPSIGRVIVSTDDREIADAARRWGAEVPFLRPPELAADDAPEWLAWRHAVRWLLNETPGLDAMVSLPPTAPLRSPEDVEACIRLYFAGNADVVVTATKASRHPSFNMVRVDESGFARIVMPIENAVHRRQDAPAVYDMTTVAYCANPDFVLRAGGLFEGKVRMVEVPSERALDIDTELDLQFARFLTENSQGASGRGGKV